MNECVDKKNVDLKNEINCRNASSFFIDIHWVGVVGTEPVRNTFQQAMCDRELTLSVDHCSHLFKLNLLTQCCFRAVVAGLVFVACFGFASCKLDKRLCS